MHGRGPKRIGTTLVEILVACAVTGVMLMVVLAGLRFLCRGESQLMKDPGSAIVLASTLESVLREVRTARRILIPPPHAGAFGEEPPATSLCYLINARHECVAYRVHAGALVRSVIGESGTPDETIVARRVAAASFRSRPGDLVRMQVALRYDQSLVVGQAALLNSQRPVYRGPGGALHVF